MKYIAEAREHYRAQVAEVDRQRMYEGRSTKSGNIIYQNAYDSASYYISLLEDIWAVEQESDEIPREILRCPVHGIPDCSPLLNGCSIPNRLAKAYLAGREK